MYWTSAARSVKAKILPMGKEGERTRYWRACQSPFWQQVFAAERDYLRQYIQPGDAVLSVGCGPALIENALLEQGVSVVGLDVSHEAVSDAPDTLQPVVASAERMPFGDACFDVVLFIVSLQFIEDYRQALSETARVLRLDARIIVMLLNPASAFFKEKLATADSYVGKTRHRNLKELEVAVSEQFMVQGEYFLGVANNQVFPSSDPKTAALYVLRGNRSKNRQP